MTKYENILHSDNDIKDSVLKIIKLLDGKDYIDCKNILDTTKFLLLASCTLNYERATEYAADEVHYAD